MTGPSPSGCASEQISVNIGNPTLLAHHHQVSTVFPTPTALHSQAQGRAAHPGNTRLPRGFLRQRRCTAKPRVAQRILGTPGNADVINESPRRSPRREAVAPPSFPCSTWERVSKSLTPKRQITVLLGLIDVVIGVGLGHAVVDDVGLVETIERGLAVNLAVAVDLHDGHVVDPGVGQLNLGQLGEAADGIAVVELDQPDALGIAADGADGVEPRADDQPAAGGEHDLVARR